PAGRAGPAVCGARSTCLAGAAYAVATAAGARAVGRTGQAGLVRATRTITTARPRRRVAAGQSTLRRRERHAHGIPARRAAPGLERADQRRARITRLLERRARRAGRVPARVPARAAVDRTRAARF